MEAAAEDDAERQRNRAKLYAPPPGHTRAQTGTGRARPARTGLDLAAARALMSQVASEDAKLAGRSG